MRNPRGCSIGFISQVLSTCSVDHTWATLRSKFGASLTDAKLRRRHDWAIALRGTDPKSCLDASMMNNFTTKKAVRIIEWRDEDRVEEEK